MTCSFFISSCTKSITDKEVPHEPVTLSAINSLASRENNRNKTNPLSRKNVRKAKKKIKPNQNDLNSSDLNSYGAGENEPEFIYLRFNAQNFTSDYLKLMEDDTTIIVQDFPFADGNLYGIDVDYTEEYLQTLRDGNVYAVIPQDNRLINVLSADAALQTQMLDTLVDVNPEDTTLMRQLLIEANYIDSNTYENLFVCGIRQPKGFVRYRDTELQTLIPVRGMEVWASNFGIPRRTFTNANGYYQIPWFYSVGAMMGTKAKNPRVNIKPFNTVGGAVNVIGQLIVNFITGSQTAVGVFSACRMQNDINIHYATHTQARYWAHLLNAVNTYDGYCQTFNIPSAPFNLTVYAHWADAQGTASALMLHQMVNANLIAQDLVTFAFRRLTALTPLQAPVLYSLVSGLLPDVILRETVNEQEYVNRGHTFSEAVMQTTFHELGHASHYVNVGNNFWIDLGITIMNATPPPACLGGYGCANQPNSGIILISEGWAEFIGTFYALRFHPEGRKFSFELSVSPGGGIPRQAETHRRCLEDERTFSSNWISTGFYNDLMDGPVAGTTTIINNPAETLDEISNTTVQQLYNALQPDIRAGCQYLTRFMDQNPGIGFNQMSNLFSLNRIIGCTP